MPKFRYIGCKGNAIIKEKNSNNWNNGKKYYEETKEEENEKQMETTKTCNTNKQTKIIITHGFEISWAFFSAIRVVWQPLKSICAISIY